MLNRLKGLKPNDLEAVRAAPLFRRMPQPAMDKLLASASVMAVPRFGTLFFQDEQADRFFLLLSGSVKLSRLSADGEEAVVSLVEPGQVFAEADMFSSARYPLSAEAVEPTRVLVFTAEEFFRCMRADPEVAFRVVEALSQRIRGFVQQIEHLHVRSSPQRVASFLLNLCPEAGKDVHFELPFEKSLIARRLGMQPETFSRALAKLRKIGVETHGAAVFVANTAKLKEFCASDDGGAGRSWKQ
ncbi:Crp/Fnr family transcriptional regulator [Azospirillum sp.]|uniref:Crp/Fnr family transcriptional regulator n=1 Tax=Azospirillum sp. TaxID=34012 RepID=UPI003D72C779